MVAELHHYVVANSNARGGGGGGGGGAGLGWAGQTTE